MFAIFKKYRHLVGRGAAESFNLITAYLTNFSSDESLDFHRPDKPTADDPPLLSINANWLNERYFQKMSGTGVVYLTGGVVSVKAIGTTAGTIAAGNHTHSGYITTADLEDYVKSEDLEDYVKSEDLDDYAEWATNATKTNSLVGTDASGNLKRAVALPTSTTTYDRVLRIAANGTTLSWANQNAVGRATNPGTTNITSLIPSVTSSAADTTTWTAGGTNGVVVRRQTRTRWNGTTLYGFYRDETYDRYGRLYSVSAETRYTIDTPTTVTWS